MAETKVFIAPTCWNEKRCGSVRCLEYLFTKCFSLITIVTYLDSSKFLIWCLNLFSMVSAGLPWPIEEKPAPEKVAWSVSFCMIRQCSMTIGLWTQSFYERKIFGCKGHKHERNKPGTIDLIFDILSNHWNCCSLRSARDADIAKKVAEMPKLVEAWRAEQLKARTKTELQKLLSVKTKY